MPGDTRGDFIFSLFFPPKIFLVLSVWTERDGIQSRHQTRTHKTVLILSLLLDRI